MALLKASGPRGLISVLLLAASAAQAAPAAPAAPAFGVQVSSFVALALREAPNDYAAIGSGTESYKSNAAAIAPTFATCGSMPGADDKGFPAILVCTSNWLPTAQVTELFEEGAAAMTASLRQTASTEGLSGMWSLGGQEFLLFAQGHPKRQDIKYLILSSQSHRHLAGTPLAASFKAAIAEGLRSLPGGFADLRGKTSSLAYDDANKNFSPGLPFCRISSIGNPSMECFTPAYVDSADAVFAAAKEAVTTALPAGFSAADCWKERQCGWDGPAKQRVVLLIGSIPPRTKTYGVRIMISANK